MHSHIKRIKNNVFFKITIHLRITTGYDSQLLCKVGESSHLCLICSLVQIFRMDKSLISVFR